MDYFATSGAASRQRTSCAIVPVYTSGALAPATKALDDASGGRIRKLIAGGDFDGKTGATLLLTETGITGCARVLLVGCGEPGKFNLRAYRVAMSAAVKTLSLTRVADAVSYLGADRPDAIGPHTQGMQGALVVEAGLYRFTHFKTGRNKSRAPRLKRLGFGVSGRADRNKALAGAGEGSATAEGVNLARELGNLPANVCTPTYLARRAREMARGRGALKVNVLGEPEMRKLKMGSLLSVSAGSREPAKFIVMRYTGAPAKARPVVLVGKGVTFDTGGISLKPPPNMDEMKFDMCGAASVFGTVEAVCRMRLPINLVGIVPAVENMPGGNATKPGDIVRSMSGQTIEILNTDAEGRLILCDALTYAARYKPAALIDIATLTGACVIALGEHHSGLMSTDDDLADDLLAAGRAVDDVAWRLPLTEDYARQLDSNFADFANVGGRPGGTITAGCFLSKFTDGQRWAHLDIAGTAWKGGKEKGASGRPVPLLVQYLKNQA